MPRLPGLVLLMAALLAGCGRDTAGTLPAACRFPNGPGAVRAALARAPGEVRLDGTPLSKCLVREADASDVQSVGAVYVDTASGLASRVRAAPHSAAAVQLGYLVGAVRRGASKTAGIHYELQRRVEAELSGIDTHSPEFSRGERAGEASG
jgi:hypothetical protein